MIQDRWDNLKMYSLPLYLDSVGVIRDTIHHKDLSCLNEYWDVDGDIITGETYLLIWVKYNGYYNCGDDGEEPDCEIQIMPYDVEIENEVELLSLGDDANEVIFDMYQDEIYKSILGF